MNGGWGGHWQVDGGAVGVGWSELISVSLLGYMTVRKKFTRPSLLFKSDKGNILLPNLVKTLGNTIPAVRVNEKSHESCQVLFLLHSIRLSLH